MVNMKIIRLYLWRPQLKIYCGKVYNHLEEDIGEFVTVYPDQNGGKFHSKFILITTTESLRLIIMTTNITNQMVNNCTNDYYVLDIGRRESIPSKLTRNERYLKQFFEYTRITVKKDISEYKWDDVHAQIMVSLPRVLSHSMCWHEIQPVADTHGYATITSTSCNLNFDIKKVLGIQRCKFRYTDKTDKFNWLLYENFDNLNEYYETEYVRPAVPYHIKRYIILYTRPWYNKWILITSANLSIAAWGCNNNYCKNVEIGIAWNFNFES